MSHFEIVFLHVDSVTKYRHIKSKYRTKIFQCCKNNPQSRRTENLTLNCVRNYAAQWRLNKAQKSTIKYTKRQWILND